MRACSVETRHHVTMETKVSAIRIPRVMPRFGEFYRAENEGAIKAHWPFHGDGAIACWVPTPSYPLSGAAWQYVLVTSCQKSLSCRLSTTLGN
jgi:hypothetical protein